MRGFDAWLTNVPDYPPEPSALDYADAREELGEDATDDEIDERANEIMAKRIQDSIEDELENAAQGRMDDYNERYGDGPY